MHQLLDLLSTVVICIDILYSIAVAFKAVVLKTQVDSIDLNKQNNYISQKDVMLNIFFNRYLLTYTPLSVYMKINA